eukprot:9345910-Pyramimonas_sp.AAC.1
MASGNKIEYHRNLVASKTRRAKGTLTRKLSWRALQRSRKALWRSGRLPCSAAEALPELLPCVPARVLARVDACWKLSQTRSRLGRAAASVAAQRRWAAGEHHHRPASTLKPSSSQRALREKSRALTNG